MKIGDLLIDLSDDALLMVLRLNPTGGAWLYAVENDKAYFYTKRDIELYLEVLSA
mgnify:CR=1 FL=1